MYRDYYLKFPDKNTALEIFEKLDMVFINEDGDREFIIQSNRHSIDDIGTLYNDDATYEVNKETGESILINPPTKIDGYHINLRVDESKNQNLIFEQHQSKYHSIEQKIDCENSAKSIIEYLINPETPFQQFFN